MPARARLLLTRIFASPDPQIQIPPLCCYCSSSTSFSSSSMAGTAMRRMSFIFGESPEWPVTELELASSTWWDELDKSEEWQRGIFYTLSSFYSFLSVLALVQLIRIQVRVPDCGWTTQKVFHLMNFLVNALRAVLFGFYKTVFLLKFKALEMMLLDAPSLLFFSTYTLLVLFWAEIYNQARSLSSDKLRPVYYATNTTVYFAQLFLWIAVSVSQSPISVEISKLFMAVISFCAALGFVICGGRLFNLLWRFPIESRGRQKKLYEVAFVTGICCTCFLIRCVLVALSTFDEEADLYVLSHPIFNLLYYLLVEIVPSAMVLFILRKLPPRRISDQYHSIK